MKTVSKAALLLLALLVLGALLVVTLRVGPSPAVEVRAESKAIGSRTAVVVRASAEGRGLAGVRVEVEQAGVAHVVARRIHRPLPPWALWGRKAESDETRAEVGRSSVASLVEGEAVVRVVAERAPTWLLHPDPVVKELRLPVRLVPPALSLLSSQHYVAQGGSGVVLYRVGATATRDGVRAGEWFFPGTPMPGGGKDDRLALFGVPWDLTDHARLRVVAEDDAGNVAEAAFVDKFFPKPPAHDRIVLEDAFLTKVVTEIRQQTPALEDRGSLLDNYLEINRELRKKNAEELVALAPRSAGTFLWTEPFLPLRNAKVMSSFADRRTYVYQGRDVDQQTHLGFDLAAVARTPVPAANRGVVFLARYFGIYGNSVLLDHGLGLGTLYSHLSSIEVKEGETVERGAVVGHTGATGLAGGDHLHFTTLVRGLPVNPLEWWDASWIRDRVASKAGPTVLAFAAPARAEEKPRAQAASRHKTEHGARRHARK
ncbi:MAG TPA: M23 family metallopeptidase [Vicinamibacteria bacterium]|nr:M23 family metallopeptidase [Vicinamibacteria bacterium]